MKNLFVAAAAFVATAMPATAATTVAWTGPTDFDSAYVNFAGIIANTIEFSGEDSSYGEGIFGPMAHTHGQTMTYSIHAVVDGIDQTIFSNTLPGTGTDVAESIVGLSPISFSGGLVTAVGFTCTNCSNYSYHQFSDTVISLSQVAGAVPEPGTWAMMMLGMLAVGAAVRRRRPEVTIRFA